MSYLGDIRLGDTLDTKFTTRQTSGAPFALASGVISAYPGNNTTALTAGITLTASFNSVTGLNHIRIVASSGNGYATATNYQLVITAGTVNSVSVVGEVIGEFSIEARSAVMPTVAARTLDVTATGAAGIDWGNIENPTAVVDFTNTTVDIVDHVTVDAIAANAITSTSIASGAFTAAKFAAGAFDAVWTVTARLLTAGTNIVLAKGTGVTGFNDLSAAQVTTACTASTPVAASVTGAVGSVTGNVGGNVTGSVGSVAANGITASSIATNAIDADALATDAVTELVNGVWNEPTASHTTAGTTGKALIDASAGGGGGASAAAVATAVWTDLLAGSDFSTASSIGKLLKDDIDATISSRLAPTTAARTLDVSATGEAGVDWANVGGQGTTVNLSATTTNVVNTATAVTTVNGLAANVITASSIATGALTAAKFAAGAFDAVWTVTARILTAGTNIVLAKGTGVTGFNDLSAAQVTTACSASTPVAASVTGSVGSVTGNVGGNVTGSVGSVVGNVGGNVTGSVGSVVGGVGGNVTGSVGSLGAQAKLDVNAEVVDALNVDTYAEPSAVPAATASLAAKINWQQVVARNKINQTATNQAVRNDADSATIGTATVADDGTTATRGKFA